MKRLEKFLRPYRRESILAPLFKLLEVVFDLMVPVVVAQIIDVGVAKNDRGYIVEMFFVLLLMAAVGLLCSFTAQFFAAKASVGFATSVRQAMFDHIQRLSFTELDTLGTDTLITRLTDDVNQVQNGINMGLRLLLRSPFVVIGAMVMAFTINVRCALIFVVTVPILFVVVFSIMLISIPLFKKVQAGLDCVTGLTRENLTGVRVIRAFCREEQSVEEFEEGNRELTRLNEFVGRISALLNPLTYVLINGATVLLIARAGVQVNIGNLQQGQVVALYNYMAQIIVELIKLASLIITLNKSMACADRVAGILDVKSSMEYKVAAEQMKNEQINADQRKYETDGENDQADSNLAVEFNHVTFTYEGAGASSLSDITFRAKKGQTIGIIGGTGSGKSTLVSLIPRFYDPQEGTVKVNGINAKGYPQGELCSEIGVVQQRSILFKGSIRDNLKWGNDQASDEDLWKAITIAQAKDVVEAKPGKLDFEVEQNGRNLSGGQKQRLTIARALVSKPEILILDDSLSALDFATDATLRKAIGELEGNVTTFLVSQRISGIRQADKILVMEDGELAGQGTHEELMETCETYQEIYYSQFPEERPAAVKSSKETGKDLDKADKMTEKAEKGAAE
ncbi:ABC transporter ATP-binding protein [Dorea longicatena]|uniref:ABC transporter ATP-binding protein n=1 Tax=Dorea longicatena TaxID=88431 RepID=UPI0022E18969|nr:ABC transporter ATP-binding protein [Dorea longicatena]